MRNTLKKSFAVLLVICMLVGMIPIATAATTEVTTLAALQSALAGASAGDVIDVTADIALTSALTVSGDVTVKSSNGSSILRASSYKSYMFVVADGGVLTLEDITVNGNRTSYQTADLATEMIVVQEGGTLNFNDGATLTTNRGNALVSGGGITVVGTLNMNGGKIVNIHMHNSASATTMYGAAISVVGGTVNMYGGIIGAETIGTADQNDGRNGAVGVVSGTFNMYGGAISGNVANEQGNAAGGVHISEGATFNLIGGSVSNNNSRRNGGAFYNLGTLNISGGTVSGNTATYTDKSDDPTIFYGGAIFNQGTLNISGGEISGNSAKSCGGAVYNYGTMTVTGGTITGNTSERYSAGAIFVDGTGTLSISGGMISGNTAGQFGGAIAVTSTASNALVITKASFSGNNCGASQCGSDIYITTANSSNVATSYIEECVTYKLYVDNTGSRYSESNAVLATSPVLTAGNGYVYVASGAGHIYGDWYNTVEPTCTTAGTARRDCQNCDAYETKTVSALGHSYDAGTVTKAATCTTAGTKLYTCTRCGATKTETIAALGHSYNAGTVTKAATCTTAGTKLYTCTRCSATKTETIPALGHTYDESQAVVVAATCTAAGSKTFTCTRCSQKIVETIPALGHNYIAKVTPATCTTAGYTTFRCSRCGDTYTGNNVPAKGHVSSDWIVKKEATKTETGLKVKECTVCGETLESEVIPVIPDPTIEIATVEATQAQQLVNVPVSLLGNEGLWAAGFYVYYSSELNLVGVLGNDFGLGLVDSAYDAVPDDRAIQAGVPSDAKCYKVYVESLDLSNVYENGTLCTLIFNLPESSTYEYPIAIAPCANDCINVDGDSVTLIYKNGAIVIPDLDPCDHVAGEWQVTKEADCTTAGERNRFCESCGKLMATEEIPALGHDFQTYETVAATCTVDGRETDKCSRCGLEQTTVIPAKGHTPGGWVSVSETEMVKRCTVCNEIVDTKVVTLDPTVYIADAASVVGGTFTTTVNFRYNPGIYGARIYVYYDEALTLTKIANGTVCTAGEISFDNNALRVDPTTNTNATKAFNACGVSMDGKYVACIIVEAEELYDITGNGVVATLTFTAPDAEGTYAVGVVGRNGIDIFNNNEEDVNFTFEEGVVTVTATPPCLHETTNTETVDATCTTAGYTKVTCAECGEIISYVTVDALGHNNVETGRTEATCTETGSVTYVCSRCSETTTETIEALGHEYDTENAEIIEATCTETGSITYTCTRCGDNVSQTIPAKGHTPGDWVIISDTQQVRYCTVCGAVVETQTISPDPTFSIPDASALTGAEFTVPVRMTGNPGIYGARIYVYYDAALTLTNIANGTVCTAGEISFDNNALRVDPTTNTNATKAFNACGVSMDGKYVSCIIIEAEELYDITGNGTVATLTFTAPDAEGTYTVGVVGRNGIDIFNNNEEDVNFTFVAGTVTVTEAPPCSHIAGVPVTTPATCTEAGSIVTRCTVCDAVIDTVVIPATGHTPGNWEVITPATDTTSGVEAIKCQVCGVEIQRRNIAPLSAASLTTSFANAVVGDSFTVSATLANNPGIWAGDFYLVFDSALTLTGVSNGSVFDRTDFYVGNLNVDPTSNTKIKNFFTKAGISTDGVLVTVVHFEHSFDDEADADVTNNGILINATFAGVAEAGTYKIVLISRPAEVINWEPGDEIDIEYIEGGVIVSEVPPCAHENTSTETVEATCTTAGYTKVTCNDCGAIVSYTTVDALGHNYSEPVVVPATCTTAGSSTGTCTRCNQTVVTTIPALGHDYVVTETIDSTCTAEGSITKTCSRCGDVVVTTIEKKAHTPGDWETVSETQQVRRCTVCGTIVDTQTITPDPTFSIPDASAITGAEFTVPVKMTGNPGIYGARIYVYYDAALTLTNIANGTVCTAGEISFDNNALRVDPTTNTNATKAFNACGVSMDGKYVSCIIIEAEELYDITGNGTVAILTFTAPDAAGTYTVGVVGRNGIDIFNNNEEDVNFTFVAGTVTVTEAPACEHEWDDGVVTTSATCTEEGVMTYTCALCGETKTEAIPANGHTFSTEWTIDVEPTETTPGSKSHHCLYCDAKTDITPIDPIVVVVKNLGDVNGDGRTNAFDLAYFRFYLKGEYSLDDIVFANADINNNGKLDSFDLYYIEMKISGAVDYNFLLEMNQG